jgi:flavin-dependent dehydrogenase
VPVDVRVLGGGPAGCAAARLLAMWGHRVALIDQPPAPGPGLPESLPPSTGKLLDLLGVRTAVDAAGFVRSTGNTVWWGGGRPRVETFAGDTPGWQVTADRLNTLLLEAAQAAGAAIETRRATVHDLDQAAAAMTLDCTGRAGLIARARHLRVFESEARTVAVIGRWEVGPAFDVPDSTHTLIESYADGWAWSVPVAPDVRAVAVMIDPRRSNLARDRPSQEIYEAEIRKTATFRTLLRDARLIGGPTGWDASMYASRIYAADHWLLVGDAASFIDPLSSAGVKKALASGWLAAVVAHTCLVQPAMRDQALAFYARREAEVYAAFRDLTRRYLSEAASGHEHPFWSDRRDEPDGASDRAAVEAALARLRAADAVSLAPGPSFHVHSRPAVSGREIVLEPRIVIDDDTAGVRHIAGVDVVALVEMAGAFRSVPDLFDAYNKRCPPVGLPEFLTALATAMARGWLREDPSGTKN